MNSEKLMKLTMDEIRLMNALEQVAQVSAKDCITNQSTVSFLVKEEDVGKAIGKNAVNVRALQDKLKKRIEIVGYQNEPEKVVAKELEITVQSTGEKNGKLVIKTSQNDKRKALGNGKFKRVKEFIKRNYDLELVIS